MYNLLWKKKKIIQILYLTALSGYSMASMRFALKVKPKNMLLFACHVVNLSAQFVQGYRYLKYRRSLRITEKCTWWQQFQLLIGELIFRIYNDFGISKLQNISPPKYFWVENILLYIYLIKHRVT